jgi:hypothetical protein
VTEGRRCCCKVDGRLAPALESLEQLLAQDGPDFYDFAFIGRRPVRARACRTTALQLLLPCKVLCMLAELQLCVIVIMLR